MGWVGALARAAVATPCITSPSSPLPNEPVVLYLPGSRNGTKAPAEAVAGDVPPSDTAQNGDMHFTPPG